jgi:hypothetical protein
MAETLCVARCRTSRHQPGCDVECVEHPPRTAAPGLRLCDWHTDKLDQNPFDLIELYDELSLRLAGGGGGGGEPVSGGGVSQPIPNDAVVEMRRTIRHTLMSWVQLIAEERGVSLPDGSPPARPVKAMSGTPIWRGQGTVEQAIAGPPEISVDQAAAFVAKHAEWLAAQEFAGEASDELSELRSKAWRVAYPSGARTIPIAPCPVTWSVPGQHIWTSTSPCRCVRCGVDVLAAPTGCVADLHRCGGTVKAIVRPADSLLPSELVCDADDGHRWPAGTWHGFRRAVKARAA